MLFRKIDCDTWERREYFEHFLRNVPCTYSMTVKVDVSRIRSAGLKLYPAMLYALSSVVNSHEEFRTAFNAAGELGVYDVMHPTYTVFHRQSSTFSSIWTTFDPDFNRFLLAYQQDVVEYGNVEGLIGKPNVPENCFSVSMIPWSSFEGFTLGLAKGFDYLLPIFTMGKYRLEGDRVLLPLALQVHHAVCDGFHACRFLNELQDLLNRNFWTMDKQ